MKNILFPLGLLSVGILLIASKKKVIKEDLSKKNLIAFFENLVPNKTDLLNIIDSIQNAMNDDEVEFLINVFINETFGVPLSGKALSYLIDLLNRYEINFDYETYFNS